MEGLSGGEGNQEVGIVPSHRLMTTIPRTEEADSSDPVCRQHQFGRPSKDLELEELHLSEKHLSPEFVFTVSEEGIMIPDGEHCLKHQASVQLLSHCTVIVLLSILVFSF